MTSTAMATAQKILADITAYRHDNNAPFPGHIVVSVADARRWDELQQLQQLHRYPDSVVKSKVRVGDRVTLWGIPCAVVYIPAGHYDLEPQT